MSRWFNILFAFLIFSGSAGVDVFKHVCSKDGVQLSLFDNANEGCSMDHESHACCTKQKQEKDCCSDEVSVIQFKFDYFQKADLFVVTNYFDLPSQPFTYEDTLGDVNEFTSGIQTTIQPPPLPGETRRAILQVYII